MQNSRETTGFKRISKDLFLFATLIIVAIGIQESSVFAACVNTTRPMDLHLVSQKETALKNPVSVSFAIEKDPKTGASMLIARFDVRTKEIYAKKHLGKKEYPYQRDVVEIFVSTSGMASDHLPYYEFELSPFDQDFQVKVISLKKPFEEGLQLGMKHSVKKKSVGWSGEIGIPLENLNWNNDPSQIIGNAFAIFGKPGDRSFWSLSLPPMEKPNFHQPQFFKPLLDCEP